MAGPTAPTTAPTAIRAGGPLLSPVRRNIIFTALVFGVLVAATGQTIVVPALPTIVAELGSTVDQSWAVTSYLLGGTVVVVVAGKLGDLLGRNRVLLGSVVVFVVGSVLCGLSQTMTMLAISRALQGVGAGAISVTAYALAAEVVPLRDRGRYQGVLGAVFGVNTVTGPLLGGWLTDYLSWRWAFWINVPVSIAVLTVAATAVPALARPPKPVIDYLGILVIAVATTALIMATSWGGTTYAWGSATIVGLLIGAAVALGFFVWLEGRARCGHPAAQAVWQPSICRVLRPVLRGRIRDAGCTDLRTDLSGVRGRRVGDRVRLRTLPMVIGLLIASTGTGVLVGRTGRYKIFPVAGMALMAVAFLLMSQMDEWTPPLLQSLYLVVLGAGIGLSMQVLVLIVQNTSSFEDLGVATSGVTFFRVVGASFGTATFGALFVNFLDRRLGSALTSGAVPVPAVPSPAVLHQLPQSMAAPIVRAYAESLTQVFLCAVSVTVVGFILALLLREVPLTDIHDDADDLGDGFGVPRAESPEDVLEIAVRRMLPNGVRLRDIATQPGCGLGVAELWALLRIYQYQRLFEAVRLTDIGRHLHVPYQVFEPVFDRLVQTGYAARDGDILTLTPSGHRQVDSLAVLIRQWLLDHLAVAPGLKRQPDHQFEAALQHVTDAVLVQRDWYEDLGDLSESRQLAATT